MVQGSRELPPHPEDYIVKTVEAPEESKQDDEDGAKETVEIKQVEEKKVEKKVDKKVSIGKGIQYVLFFGVFLFLTKNLCTIVCLVPRSRI